MIKFRFIVTFYCLAITMLSFGQRATLDEQMIGNTDLVVVGTITEVLEVPGTMGIQGEKNFGNFRSHNAIMKQISFSVEELLKGMDKTQKITVSIPVQTNQKIDWPIVGETKIFYLQKSQDGYAVVYGLQSIQALEKIEEADTLIKSVPLILTLNSIKNPLFIGKTTPITVTVTNLTDTPLTLRNFNLSGFFHAKRMESAISFSTTLYDRQNMDTLAAIPQQITLDAKSTKEISLYVTTHLPQSMALLGPDSYMITIAALCGKVSYSTDNAKWLNTRSNWQDAYLGFPLADEPITE